MAKSKGRTAQPKKSAGYVQGLSVDEVLTLFGGNKHLVGMMMDEWAERYKKMGSKAGEALFVVNWIFQNAAGKLTAKDREFLNSLTEDTATWILRGVSREVAAGRMVSLNAIA